MIRITTADEPAQTRVIVDGELLRDCIDAVEISCNQAISRGKPVQFLLRDVSNIDECGRLLMYRLAGKGVTLKGTGLYTSCVVEAINSEHAARRQTPSWPEHPKVSRQ